MAYSEPKVDWTSNDPISNDDFNRIEGNVKSLKEENITIEGDKTFTGNNAHNGNDDISGTKTMNNPTVQGTVNKDGAIENGSKTDNTNATYTGTKDFTGADVSLPGDINGFTPIGGIIMWSGDLGALPANWTLCDGRTENGKTTPDLTNKFIKAADSNSDIGFEGGSNTHSHTGGTTDDHELTEDEIPAHNHNVTDLGHDHELNSDPSVGSNQENNAGSGANQNITWTTETGYANISEADYGGADPKHSHTFDTPSEGNEPEYFTLAFIMRTA